MHGGEHIARGQKPQGDLFKRVTNKTLNFSIARNEFQKAANEFFRAIHPHACAIR